MQFQLRLECLLCRHDLLYLFHAAEIRSISGFLGLAGADLYDDDLVTRRTAFLDGRTEIRLPLSLGVEEMSFDRDGV